MKLWRPTLAIAAIVLVAAAVASDFVIGSFWVAHPMVSAIVSALLVVLLSVAVIEAVLSRRAERRWSLLAQRAFIDLAEAAYATRRALAEALGTPERADTPPDQTRADLASQEKAPAIRRYVEAWLDDSAHRTHMDELLTARLATYRQLVATAIAPPTLASVTGGPLASLETQAASRRTCGSSTACSGRSPSRATWRTERGTSRCGSRPRSGGTSGPPTSRHHRGSRGSAAW